jgi:DNA ligase 1
MPGSFLKFAELNDALTGTTKKLEKRALIATYLRELVVEDASLATLYLAGTPFAETDRRVLNVGGSLLSKALAEVSGANQAAMHAAYRRHGDLGAAAEDLLRARVEVSPSLTLPQVRETFDAVAVARGSGAKLPLLVALLEKAAPVEAKYLLKLMTGDMRTGVKQSLVEEAIADAFDASAAEVRRASMLLGDLAEVFKLASENRLAEARMKLFHPLGFMLASPVASVEEAVERFAVEIVGEASGEDAEKPSDEEIAKAVREPSPSLHGAILEDKYDGIRAQLHCGDVGEPGRVELFSRSREDLSASFPELAAAFGLIPERAILDGEILAWNAEIGRALPFSALQQRLGRKRVTQEMQAAIPVIFMAFDLLSLGEELLLEQPLHERRELLEAFAIRHSSQTANAVSQGQSLLFPETTRSMPRLMVAPSVRLANAEQLDAAYFEARQRGNEGVMLKSLHSAYQPGRRGLAWLKLKRELATLDVVVTGAEFGHGRRAGVLSDYTFAVRDGEELKNVGKAYSGLTDSEIDELTRFFQEHTLEDYGGFRTVEPLKVLEVAFNNVMRSERHNSGFALRFPRILRIRDDKPVSEIDTLERVEEIYDSQPDK